MKKSFKTFDEWKAMGYHVIKGQKAAGRNAEGKATFSRAQVEANNWNPGDYDQDDMEADYDFGYAMGLVPGSKDD